MHTIQIVTHNGIFHGDEVIACAILKLYGEDRGKDIKVIRTRSKDILDNAIKDKETIVIDVGGQYNPELNNYDHHQKDFNHFRESNNVKYSSAGLIWKHYGKKIPNVTHRVWEIMDNNIISAVDAVDNGINGLSSPISSVIAGLNLSWKDASVELEREAFFSALTVATLWLRAKIRTIEGDVEAEDYVHNATLLHDNKVLLLEQFVPWQNIVCNNPKFNNVQFVIFKDKYNGWRIQSAPVSEKSFELRKPLPDAWAGLSEDELSKVTGVSDALFCHIGKFIAGTATKESILKLAEMAVNS